VTVNNRIPQFRGMLDPGFP